MPEPREPLLNLLGGKDRADAVVVTAETGHTPPSDVERRLRNLGMCLVAAGPPLARSESPSVQEERVLVHTDGGHLVEQRRVHTPAGELHSVVRHDPDMGRSRTVKRLFQTPRDYAPLMAMVADERYLDNADEVAAFVERAGADVLVRPRLGYTPMHAIMHEYMGLEVFAEEWARNRQRVIELGKALIENRRRLFEAVARAPVAAITYGGHVNARELGEERLNRYFLPAFHEFADVMHANDKLAGVHISGDPAPLTHGLARSRADYVEGFRPTRDFGLAEARRAWPKAAIWVEMPPDVHQRPADDRVLWVGAILTHGRGQRVALEVAADLPPAASRQSLQAAAAALEASPKEQSRSRPEEETT